MPMTQTRRPRQARASLRGAVLGALLGAWAPAHAQAPVQVPAALEVETSATGSRRGMALWVHPQDVGRSAVLVAEGDAGLALYALDGGLVRRELVGGTVTDVDVALAPPSALGASSLVLAVDATREELVLLTVDPATLALTPVPGSPISAGAGVRLGAFHVSADRTEASVIAAAPTGDVRQWVLVREGQGPMNAELARDFSVSAGGFGLTALAVDGRTQRLYLLDRIQLQSVSSAPDGGTYATLVDVAGGGSGQLVSPSDMALLTQRDGGGYLLVADSSRRALIVYERADVGLFVSAFQLLPPDGGTRTLWMDGVAVQAFALGGAFDAGLLVTAGSNGGASSLAFTRWGQVAAAFTPPLRTDPLNDPRGAPPDAGTSPDGGKGGGGVVGGGGGGSFPPPPSTAGCACSETGGAGAGVALAFLLLGLRRRKRS